MNEEEFWNRVKQLIKKRNVTHEEFAEACDINYGTFRGWIHRNIYPTVVDGYAIARVLGVSLEYLIIGSDKQNKRRASKIEKACAFLHNAEKTLDRIV
jgi:transcriptional regulator with XRE-family HTH domain